MLRLDPPHGQESVCFWPLKFIRKFFVSGGLSLIGYVTSQGGSGVVRPAGSSADRVGEARREPVTRLSTVAVPWDSLDD